MNIDSGFFYILLSKGDPRPLSHVSPDYFAGPWRNVYDFVIQCLSDPTMRRLPQVETVAMRFELDLVETTEDIAFYIGLLNKRCARLALEDSIQQVALPLIEDPDSKDHDPIEAAHQLMMTCSALRRKYRAVYGETLDYNEDVAVRIQDYNQRKQRKGLIGIPYPYDAMNNATGGMIGGELAVFFAESGLGKTWMLAQVVQRAREAGYAGACFSQEMKPGRLAIRLDALGARVSPDRFRRGCLKPAEEERVRAYYENLPRTPKLHMFGPKDIRALSDFEATIAALRPHIDFIVWDAPYLICRAEKWEMKTDFVQGLKELAEDYNIPMFVTWQLNRKGEPALTDAIKTDADHNFVADDEGLRELCQIRVRSSKTRDGLQLDNLLLQWDISEGMFSELSWAIRGGGSSKSGLDYAESYAARYGE